MVIDWLHCCSGSDSAVTFWRRRVVGFAQPSCW